MYCTCSVLCCIISTREILMQEEYESAIRRETKLFILKGNLGEGLCINLPQNVHAQESIVVLCFFWSLSVLLPKFGCVAK